MGQMPSSITDLVCDVLRTVRDREGDEAAMEAVEEMIAAAAVIYTYNIGRDATGDMLIRVARALCETPKDA